MTEAQFEAVPRLFREGASQERREEAAAIERELLAEARRAIGLASIRRITILQRAPLPTRLLRSCPA
jgi:hypothetical protein